MRPISTITVRYAHFDPSNILGGTVSQLPEESLILLAELSPAVKRVAKLVALGLTNKEIAIILNRSPGTVKRQVSWAIRGLNVQSRCQLIVLLLSGRRPQPVEI